MVHWGNIAFLRQPLAAHVLWIPRILYVSQFIGTIKIMSYCITFWKTRVGHNLKAVWRELALMNCSGKKSSWTGHYVLFLHKSHVVLFAYYLSVGKQQQSLFLTYSVIFNLFYTSQEKYKVSSCKRPNFLTEVKQPETHNGIDGRISYHPGFYYRRSLSHSIISVHTFIIYDSNGRFLSLV